MRDRELADKIHTLLKEDDLAGADLIARQWQKKWPKIAERAFAAVDRIINGGSIDPDSPPPPPWLDALPQPLVKGSRGTAYYRVGFLETSKFHGQTVTFRVRAQPKDAEFAAGKTVLAYCLDDDDWEADKFEGCAFITDKGYIALWQRFQGKNSRIIQGCRRLEVNPLAAAVTYGKDEVRCAVCGAELTNEESRELGIGPICRQKFRGQSD